MAKTNPTADEVASRERREGAGAFDQLLRRIQGISDATCDRFGEDKDGRDYAAMRTLVDQELRRHTALGGGQYEGFIRGMTLMLCLNADGCGMSPGDYDANQVMAETFGEEPIPPYCSLEQGPKSAHH
ncbi:MAG: hypothetical protein EOP38_24090 [Rubrivivax sp.]|nr:MAG: hypothetical protein EOP38_24090 [Rubrivivax sp.]